MESIDNMDQRELREWLRCGLKKNDKSRSGAELSRLLGLERTAISKIVSGTRKIQSHELRRIAEYIGEPIPFAPEPVSAQPEVGATMAGYVGDISAGLWADMSIQELAFTGEIKEFPLDDFKPFRQGFLRVIDDSCNLLAQKGEIVWVVDYPKVRSFPQNKDIVIVKLQQSVTLRNEGKELVQWVVRRVKSVPGQPIVLGGMSAIPGISPDILYAQGTPHVEITHLVVATGKPIIY